MEMKRKTYCFNGSMIRLYYETYILKKRDCCIDTVTCSSVRKHCCVSGRKWLKTHDDEVNLNLSLA